MSKKTYLFFGIAALGALLGIVYSSYSTGDFIAHLDRQLHPVSCSLMPGVEEVGELSEKAEGCKVALFSPYSSFSREKYWGGVPISLFAVGLFGFALAMSVWAMASRKGHKVAPGLFVLLAGLAAVGASVVMFVISTTKLHTICTTCMGTYISSAILLVGGVLAFLFGRMDRKAASDEEGGSDTGLPLLVSLAVVAVEMGVAVFLPVIVYVSTVPDYTKYVTSCDTLKAREDKQGVLLSVGNAKGTEDAVFVFDPLCPACKAFHKRIEESRFASSLAYKLMLLPLDSECNWMLKDSMHPGSCLLSKALLCAGDKTGAMMDFIFDNQEAMRMDGIGKKIDAIRGRIVGKFPEVKDCLDSPDTKIRLNKALHYAVANSLPLLTPQLYLNGKRLCDEDTDLGLDFALTKLLAK